MDLKGKEADFRFRCNIGARGKMIRLVYGLIFLLTGILLLPLWAWGSGSPLAWTVALGLVAGGAFAVFEARAGWCVLRAMGIRTPF